MEPLQSSLASTGSTSGTSASDASQLSSQVQLSQSDFLTLLTAQLKNQDPDNPADPSQFLGQMAAISEVDGIDQLQQTVGTLSQTLTSGQALQAASLVNQAVEVPSSSGVLDSGSSMDASVTLPSNMSQVTVAIQDQNGQTVQTLSLGAGSTGTMNFSWDGSTASGGTAAPGVYQMVAQGVANGKSSSLTTSAVANVDSVSIGTGGALTLNLDGLGPVSYSQVSAIY